MSFTWHDIKHHDLSLYFIIRCVVILQTCHDHVYIWLHEKLTQGGAQNSDPPPTRKGVSSHTALGDIWPAIKQITRMKVKTEKVSKANFQGFFSEEVRHDVRIHLGHAVTYKTVGKCI